MTSCIKKFKRNQLVSYTLLPEQVWKIVRRTKSGGYDITNGMDMICDVFAKELSLNTKTVGIEGTKEYQVMCGAY